METILSSFLCLVLAQVTG